MGILCLNRNRPSPRRKRSAENMPDKKITCLNFLYTLKSDGEKKTAKVEAYPSISISLLGCSQDNISVA